MKTGEKVQAFNWVFFKSNYKPIGHRFEADPRRHGEGIFEGRRGKILSMSRCKGDDDDDEWKSKKVRTIQFYEYTKTTA